MERLFQMWRVILVFFCGKYDFDDDNDIIFLQLVCKRKKKVFISNVLF
jgi:hypothetical protein